MDKITGRKKAAKSVIKTEKARNQNKIIVFFGQPSCKQTTTATMV